MRNSAAEEDISFSWCYVFLLFVLCFTVMRLVLALNNGGILSKKKITIDMRRRNAFQ